VLSDSHSYPIQCHVCLIKVEGVLFEYNQHIANNNVFIIYGLRFLHIKSRRQKEENCLNLLEKLERLLEKVHMQDIL
jgi:hypothetical protein